MEGGLGGRVDDLLPPTEEELGAAQPAFLQAIEETRRQLQAGDSSLLDKCVLMYLIQIRIIFGSWIPIRITVQN